MLNRTPISERAKGRWRDILIALGVDAAYLSGKHCGCPICNDGKDRFRFDNKDGKGTYYCNVHGSGDGVKLLQELKGWDFKQTVKEIEAVIGKAAFQEPKKPHDAARARDAMVRVWKESRPVEAGDPVTLYLRNRGIELTPAITNLRYCEQLAYRDTERRTTTYHPGMVAVVMDASGKPVNLHRTYISLDGCKADVPIIRKLMTGPQPDGSAVRLMAHGETLGVAEGIETALAAWMLNPDVPVWATLNAGRLEAWIPPEGVKRVIIYGDNDGNFRGQKATYCLAYKLSCKGIVVEDRIPGRVQTDWADIRQNVFARPRMERT